MTQIRLQRLIASAGIAARRKAEEMILAGRVTVDGVVVTVLGTKVDPIAANVQVDGNPVAAQDHFYILFNKPKACITAVTDDRGRVTVMDYLPNLPVQVAPVGRLDYYSEGVLLLTNDGELAAKLLAPGSHVPKTYHVKVNGQLRPTDLQRLRDGVTLDDGTVTAAADVEALANESKHPWLAITLYEGKSRQIHRMLEALGHRVSKLQRVAFANLTFHGLRVGDARELTQSELNDLRAVVGLDRRAVARGRWSAVREDTDRGRAMRIQAAEAAEAARATLEDAAAARPAGRGRSVDDDGDGDDEAVFERQLAERTSRPRFAPPAPARMDHRSSGDRPAPRTDRPTPRMDRPGQRTDRPEQRDRPAPRTDRPGQRSDRPTRPSSDRPTRPSSDRPTRPSSDRPTRPSSDRPAPRSDRPMRPSGDRPTRPSSDRPMRASGDRPMRPSSDRPARPSGDRPTRPSGDRPTRPSGDRPTRPSGDRPTRPSSDRPTRPSSDRPAPRSDRPAPRGDSARPSFGDRRPAAGGRPSTGRSFGGDRPVSGDRRPASGDRRPAAGGRPSTGRSFGGDRPSGPARPTGPMRGASRPVGGKPTRAPAPARSGPARGAARPTGGKPTRKGPPRR